MIERRKRARTTGIEWTEHTWNPFVGCTIHTAGCANCYAMRQAHRIVGFGNSPAYEGTVTDNADHPTWTGRVNRSSDATWRKPYNLREPSIIFVNSMSDFFHPAALDEWRLDALKVMAETPHQYQVLTKRPEEIAGFLDRTGASFPINAWIGCTVERGDYVHRIDVLREVPAKIRFLSIEPLIGPMGPLNLDEIHWVITGGESGPGARPMDVAWLREVHQQCAEQRVPAFFKQYGLAKNNPLWQEAVKLGHNPSGYVLLHDPVGKGGSQLDGREWKQYPDFQVQRSLI